MRHKGMDAVNILPDSDKPWRRTGRRGGWGVRGGVKASMKSSRNSSKKEFLEKAALEKVRVQPSHRSLSNVLVKIKQCNFWK